MPTSKNSAEGLWRLLAFAALGAARPHVPEYACKRAEYGVRVARLGRGGVAHEGGEAAHQRLDEHALAAGQSGLRA